MLLQRERVDRPHEPQVAFELACPPRDGAALRDLGLGGVERDARLDVEVGAQRVDGRVEAQPRLGLVDVEAAGALPHAGQLAFELASLDAQRLELLGGQARRFGLAAAALAQPVGQRVDAGPVLGEATGDGGERLVAGEQVEALALGGGLRRRVAVGEARLDVGEPAGEQRAALLDGGAVQLRGAGGAERGAGRLDRPFGLGARDLRGGGVGLGLLERPLGDRGPVAPADVPGAVAAEAVAVGGDRHDLGLLGDEVERGAPVADEDVPVEEPAERDLEGVVAGPDRVAQHPGARWGVAGRWPEVVAEHEQQRGGLTGAQPGDGLAGGARAAHHDGAHRVPERRGDRRLGAGLDLEVVDERTDHAGHGVELDDRGVGAGGAQLTLERVGAGTGAGRVAFGAPPALLRGVEGVLGGRGGVERVGAGQRELGGVERGQVVAQRHRVGDERLDDTGVGGRGQLALEPAALLGQQRGEAPAALAERLDPRHPLGEALHAEDGEGRLRADDRVVERGETVVQRTVTLGELLTLVAEAGQAGLEAGELVADEVEAQGAQLVDHGAVPLGGARLALEGGELAAHLAQQVLEAHQVRLGGDEAPLGALLASPELQDAGCLLDDRPPVVGCRGEDRVELALPDDHVLLPADPGVGQQLLEVEEPARHPVQLVLGLARAEQAAGDRDLAELDRQEVRRVVDRERHLGAAERGAVRRAREDHVVHAGAAQRPRPLRAEHPRDRVDEVRLPRAVRADDDRDARLELQRRLVGERLEAPQGQGLQEHPAAPSLSRDRSDAPAPHTATSHRGDPGSNGADENRGVAAPCPPRRLGLVRTGGSDPSPGRSVSGGQATPNPTTPVGVSSRASTSSTRAWGGPAAHQASTQATASGGPSRITSTRPSARLRTTPSTPRCSASVRQRSR